MDSEQQNMCTTASINAGALEDVLLTYDSVIGLKMEEAKDVIDRCEQIIHCMRECFCGNEDK